MHGAHARKSIDSLIFFFRVHPNDVPQMIPTVFRVRCHILALVHHLFGQVHCHSTSTTAVHIVKIRYTTVSPSVALCPRRWPPADEWCATKIVCFGRLRRPLVRSTRLCDTSSRYTKSTSLWINLFTKYIYLVGQV